MSFGWRRYQTKFGFYHVSSHMGDEYLINTGPAAIANRINYVTNSIVWGNSYQWNEAIRTYIDAAWAFNFDGGARPWQFQFGAEYSPMCATGFRGSPFVAANGHILQALNWGGNIVLQVEKIEGAAISTRVIVGGELSDSKGINKLGGGLSAEALTEKDHEDIRFAAEIGADYLGVSFVRHGADVETARMLLRSAGSDAHVVSKIERREALDNIDEIIAVSDVIMVARGDLGVEIGDAEVPGVQKRLISESRAENTVVITATQMMQSMVTAPQPTRAEVSDVSNAVLDGTDAVMLSAESAIGRHPVKVVAALDRICLAAERHRSVLVSGHRMESRFDSVEETIAMATMYTANHYNVVGILTLTESGTTAKWMSRISSGIQIFGMTRNQDTERRMALYRGVYPVPYDATQLPRGQVNRAVVAELESRSLVAEGDWLIITKGDFSGVKGGTNSMKIVKVGEVAGERE